eukprot:tig00000970_g5833.t1
MRLPAHAVLLAVVVVAAAALQNEAPRISVPDATAVVVASSSSNAALAGISVADTDAGTSALLVVVEAQFGQLKFSSSPHAAISSLSSSGPAAAISFTGPLSAVNAMFANSNFLYTATAGFAGVDAVRITVDDQGNTGQGGAQADSALINVRVLAEDTATVNDAPGLYFPLVKKVMFAGPYIADADSGSSSLRLTVSSNLGKVSLANTTGLNFTEGTGVSDQMMIFTGTQESLNEAVRQLTYLSEGYGWLDTIRISLDDQGATGTGGTRTTYYSIDLMLNAYSKTIEPSVTSVFPPSGPSSGGTVVTVRGGGFVSSDNLRCRFDSLVVPSTFVSDKELRCETPSGLSGLVVVEVSNDNIAFSSSGVQFEFFVTPRIQALFPASTASLGVSLVLFAGTNLISTGTSQSLCQIGEGRPTVGRALSTSFVLCEAYLSTSPTLQTLAARLASDGFTYIPVDVKLGLLKTSLATAARPQSTFSTGGSLVGTCFGPADCFFHRTNGSRWDPRVGLWHCRSSRRGSKAIQHFAFSGDD